MGRMRWPALSIHGIEGAFYGAGAKTVIPAKVSGKFSIRFVPLASLYWYNLILISIRTQSRPAANAGEGVRADSQVHRRRVQETRNEEQAYDRAVARRQGLGRGPQALEL